MKNRVVRLALFTAMCLTPVVARAQTSLASAHPGVLGQGMFRTIASGSQLYLRYTLTANRSYYAVCWSQFGTDQVGDCNVEWRNAVDVSVGVSTEVEPFNTVFSVVAGDAESLLPTTSASFYVRVSNVSPADTTINIMVVENTLFTPWWFVSPSAGYDSYVEMRNNTEQTITATVRVYDLSGALIGTAPRTIAANGTALVQVSALVPGAASGSASITFMGPPGSIAANVTTLGGGTGLSFGALFTPRANLGTFGSLQ